MGDNCTKNLDLFNSISFDNLLIEGGHDREVYLSEVKSFYEDQQAVKKILKKSDPIIYKVSAIESSSGEGQLHYGLGTIFPGKVGSEYFFTKGHFHEWRAAAEVYIGLKGQGMMLLEEESSRDIQTVPLKRNSITYVPGNTAHRTINTGKEPLIYLGVYPSNAGHDYGSIATRNFLNVVIESGGQPTTVEREAYRKIIVNHIQNRSRSY